MACVLKVATAAFALFAAAKLCNACEGGSKNTSTNVFQEFWQGNDGVWTLLYTDSIVTSCKWQKPTEISETNVTINTSYISGKDPVNTEYTWYFLGNESMSRQAGTANVPTDGLRCRLQRRTFHELLSTAKNIEKVPNCLQKYNEEIAKIPGEKEDLKTGYTKELCEKSAHGPSSTPSRTA
ncbi:uncharacterized protein [Dermacentor albipictus]|uniref:uncharacterized protein isoform X4 n=1 Tax=Dermacentor albipictus TaxID=60249 RepID=UPI0031FD4306